MSNTIEAEATLENCRALINQINAGLSAEEPFANVSSATELLLHLECADSALKRSVSRSRERGDHSNRLCGPYGQITPFREAISCHSRALGVPGAPIPVTSTASP